ncbi:hypothetical protein B0H12DRAFT_51595 [Mycena haematopus]|nr:hypothetical protein B0H12DRAFT_51595 [Mycena haematopus]
MVVHLLRSGTNAAALNALLNSCRLMNGKPALIARNLHSCFYADGPYDPDPERGLRSPSLLLTCGFNSHSLCIFCCGETKQVARHIWPAPNRRAEVPENTCGACTRQNQSRRRTGRRLDTSDGRSAKTAATTFPRSVHIALLGAPQPNKR